MTRMKIWNLPVTEYQPFMEVQLCNQIGHARPEEGSEHYFAYAVENVMGKGLPHGDLVGCPLMYGGTIFHMGLRMNFRERINR
ncbi:MAG: hypothetical protein ACE5FD_10510 [Anaerolineae bacterium]